MRALHPLAGDLEAFAPTRAHPVRLCARERRRRIALRATPAPWAQLACCATGMVQAMSARHAKASDGVAFIVPPSRAVWIAPGALHQVPGVETAHLRTLYVEASALPASLRSECRVLVVSALLRELIGALDPAEGTREVLLAALVLDEIAQCQVLPIGVPLPDPRRGDKRLRALCAAALRAPQRHATLAQRAAGMGAGERTVARLSREQLGLSYPRRRQQVALAHALPLLAQGSPVGEVAAATGYASESAFFAMFRAAMGESPRRFRCTDRTALPGADPSDRSMAPRIRRSHTAVDPGPPDARRPDGCSRVDVGTAYWLPRVT